MVRTHPTATAIKDSCDTCSRFDKKEKKHIFRFIFTTHLWHGDIRLTHISSQVDIELLKTYSIQRHIKYFALSNMMFLSSDFSRQMW